MRLNKYYYLFIGTTAELIKLVPVIRELKRRKIDFKIISSNQNVLYFNELEPLVGKQSAYYKSKLKPIKTFINSEYLSFFIWTIKTFGNIILYFNNEFKRIERKKVLFIVHGDTVSSLLGAIAAKINRTKIVHIESGLRSYNFFEPFPEELCRFIVSKLADVHFCPNPWAVNNLKKISGIKINTVNNTLAETVRDALRVKNNSEIQRNIPKEKFFILVLHRQEHMLLKKNLTKKLMELFIEHAKKDMFCILVLHKLTEDFVRKEGLLGRIRRNKNVILVPRLSYIDFIHLMNRAEFIATDGGSNQEEAYYMGKPCIILRNVTERIEGLGENALLSNVDEHIIRRFIKNYKKYQRKPASFITSPSKIIVDYLINNQYE